MKGTFCTVVVEQVLLAEPVITEEVPMVGAEDDQRVVEPPAAGHVLEQAAEVGVELRDQPLVRRARTVRMQASFWKLTHSSCWRYAAATGCALRHSASLRSTGRH